MKQFLAVLTILVSFGVSAEINEAWENYSDPAIRDASYVKAFEALPLQGVVTDPGKLWANDYWPSRRGSINYRWNAENPKGFNLKSPKFEEVQTMSLEQIATLAPSEKLDLLNGDFEYSVVKDVEKKSNKFAEAWHGICNGWAPASVNHVEPTAKTLVNPHGTAIPFGSSDIKALLSYYYAFKHDVDSTRQMGKRCFFFGPGCDEDLNAGAFHIVLTNTVGLRGLSFIADVEGGRQVWNHAVSEYVSTVVGTFEPSKKKSAKGTVRRVRLKTEMTFVQEIKKNNWGPVLGTDQQIYGVRHYEYDLDIDAYGNIIGGNWISKVRPDFIWEMAKATSFGGSFVRLSELLND